MLINQSVIPDIKAIIANAQDKAIRAVDTERTLMTGTLANAFLKKNNKEKREPNMVLISLNFFPSNYNLNMVAAIQYAKYTGIVNFIAHFQLCLHCGHN